MWQGDNRMNRDIALKLVEKAEEVAKHYSNPDREFNFNKETFTVAKIKPLSELTALIFFDKTGGKKAIAFAYWMKNNGGYWAYFL